MAEFVENISALLDYEQNGTSLELVEELTEMLDPDSKSVLIDCERDQLVQFMDADMDADEKTQTSAARPLAP
jgi:hypothetical protein